LRPAGDRQATGAFRIAPWPVSADGLIYLDLQSVSGCRLVRLAVPTAARAGRCRRVEPGRVEQGRAERGRAEQGGVEQDLGGGPGGRGDAVPSRLAASIAPS